MSKKEIGIEQHTIDNCLAQKENVEALLDSVHDGILAVDRDLRVLWINAVAGRSLGVEGRSRIGSPLSSLVARKFPGLEELCLKTIREGEAIRDFVISFGGEGGEEHKITINTAVIRGPEGIRGAVVLFRDITEIYRLRRELDGGEAFHGLVGRSPTMRGVFSLIDRVAPTDASVLVLGESGTGKEIAARAIHARSRRSAGPFVVVNCSALAESLLESELFGHLRGAFTGAVADRKGRFELAEGGTLFLDEVGDISPQIQVKLLRVLQEKVVERVGDAKPIHVDARVISATNQDLRTLIEQGRFREDLYYRLKVVTISLPPLRERREDIPLIVEHIIANLRRTTGRPISGVTPAAMEALFGYCWPGNVRELENALEHAFVLCRRGRIDVLHLPHEIVDAEYHRRICLKKTSTRLSRSEKDAIEKEALAAALDKANWNRSEAARILGVSRVTVWKRMKKYGLENPSD